MTTWSRHPNPGRLRRFVRDMGVWRGVVLLTLASTLVAFTITGLSLHVTGLEHRIEGYAIALACSLTIVPGMVASLLSLIRRLDETEEQLYRLARTDQLTGLPNRRALFETVLGNSGERTPIALLFIDIDHFKRVNDTYGHQKGDEILCRATRELACGLRHGDLLYRYGGEEFAVLLRDTGANAALALAERIREHVARTPIEMDSSADPCITVSIGVAIAADTRLTGIHELIDQADRAVYQAKHAGRNCTRVS